ncbi:MAG: DUF4249 domain-containing protein [Bacteroidia bacterium]|nr:DUF4249 domain-containing protein [Bacteroidia bacterium]MDW8302579.1 DUF4249 family protein [Bacteroidia bacterium]
MKLKPIGVLSSLILIGFLLSCSTELKVNAEKKEEILVAYGLLDPSQPKQYVRIYKAFLVEGNAIEYAKNNDLSISADAIVQIKGYNNAGNLVQTITLTPEIIQKPAGSFYPTERVWTTTTAINPALQYELYAELPDGKKITSSRISLSNGLTILAPLSATTLRLERKNAMRYQFSGNSVKAVDIEAFFLYSYKDFTTNLITEDTIHWVLGRNIVPQSNGAEYVFPIPEDVFAEYVNSILPESKRVNKEFYADKLIFKITGAGKELYDYMRVNAPDNGFQETKPEYTNINGGYGLFSSRISDTTMVYISDSTKYYIRFK